MGDRRRWVPGACSIVLALGWSAALAQQSASFRLAEQVLNAGGHPAGGLSPSSSSFRITLESIGGGLHDGALSSGSFVLEGGFPAPYPPPGEVQGFDLPAETSLIWNAERSAGDYNVYRGALTVLPALAYGSCYLQDVTATGATEGGVPPVGTGWFYLVTVENRLGEEGTKGFRSSGAERNGSVCP